MAETEDPAAFAPFRPRRGRRTAIATSITSVVVFAVVALVLPGPAEAGNWRVPDRVFFLGIGVALAAGVLRFASLRAVPTRESLTVRNIMLTRTVDWRSITDISFSGGDPWVSLELDDGDSLAVMAIQRADGEFGRAEAGRLAALVQALGPSATSPEVTLD
jgi:MFS family permease